LERYLDALGLLTEERIVLEDLYEPLKQALAKSNETAKKLTFVSCTVFDIMRHASRGLDLFDRRKSVLADQESIESVLSEFFDTCQQSDFDRETTKKALNKLLESFKPTQIKDKLRKDKTVKDFADWYFDVQAFSTTYAIKFDDKDLRFLSPGEKGIVLLLLYLEAEEGDNRPLIIDQPDDNLDNLSVYPNLINYFRARKKTRQIIIARTTRILSSIPIRIKSSSHVLMVRAHQSWNITAEHWKTRIQAEPSSVSAKMCAEFLRAAVRRFSFGRRGMRFLSTVTERSNQRD
jgi:hypothetical protein